MRKLKVSTLVTLDGVIQDPGGFGETDQGGWASPYFTEQAGQEAYAQLMASDYFLCGAVRFVRHGGRARRRSDAHSFRRRPD